jgi:hypothetical protein
VYYGCGNCGYGYTFELDQIKHPNPNMECPKCCKGTAHLLKQNEIKLYEFKGDK